MRIKCGLLLLRFRGVALDGVWIGELDSLTTYINYSALQVITALSLISTLYQSLAHAKSFQSSLVSKVEILQLSALTSLLSDEYPATELLLTVKSTTAPSLLSLPCRAWFNCQPSTEIFHSSTNYFTSVHSTELHSVRVSQSQSYFATGDLPPISSSWSQVPWNPRSIFFSTEHLWL
jgi:hypothetical protein